MRTDVEIVRQTEELAREIANLEGKNICEGVRPWESENCIVKRFWNIACLAQERLTNTSPSDAIANLGL